MSDYKKKKQLLEDNKDMYISEYDKNLSYEALSQIVDAKKEYADAAKNNDKTRMTKANNTANAVRAKYGSYTGGEFGDEYHPFAYAKTDYDDYTSKYEDELDKLYDSVKNSRSDFRYDVTEDPVFLAYKSVYDKKGSLAYDRALAENSLRTGGMPNTNAQSAASQALSYYNSQLASIIPELYEAAYDRYYKSENDKLSRLKDAYSLVSKREERDYSRHLDKLNQDKDMRDLLTKRTEAELDRIFKRTESEAERDFRHSENEAERSYQLQKQDLSNQSKSQERLYDMIRDRIDDEKWRSDHNLSAAKGKKSGYYGNIGSGDILSYARDIFAKPDLTLEELNRLLGL